MPEVQNKSVMYADQSLGEEDVSIELIPSILIGLVTNNLTGEVGTRYEKNHCRLPEARKRWCILLPYGRNGSFARQELGSLEDIQLSLYREGCGST